MGMHVQTSIRVEPDLTLFAPCIYLFSLHIAHTLFQHTSSEVVDGDRDNSEDGIEPIRECSISAAPCMELTFPLYMIIGRVLNAEVLQSSPCPMAQRRRRRQMAAPNSTRIICVLELDETCER